LFEVIPAYIAHRKGEHAETQQEFASKGRLLDQRIKKLRISNRQSAAALTDVARTEDLLKQFAGVLRQMVFECVVADSRFVKALSDESAALEVRRLLEDAVNVVLGDFEQALGVGDPAT